jgi:Ca-activated chloride channel family protein
MMITYVKPWYLLLLNLIPLIILVHFVTLKRKRSHALEFANFEAIARIKGVDLISKNIFILVLTSVIITLLTFSLAGITLQRTVYSSSFSFSLAIDSSKSMEATDFSPNRLEAAKQTALAFIDTVPAGTKMVIVSFSGNSFIEQRLTNDKTLLRQAVRGIPLSSVGGTDIAEAIITSTNLLEGEDAKAVILISDGRVNVGTIDDAITYANNNDVITHTIAIGTEEGGETSYGISKVDIDALKAIAYNTGGQSFRAENPDEFKQQMLSIMELKFKKTSSSIVSYTTLLAMILFVIEYILVNTRYRVLP